MLRDLAADPNATAEERKMIDQWVTSHAQASGIAELGRPGKMTHHHPRCEGTAVGR